jgi:peptidoglycan/LPS O-acetylase OafA/YrhL
MAQREKQGYLPTLDGWRAFSVMAVILYHDSTHSFWIFSTEWFHDIGGFGVDIFFAISGILICTRLLEEERRFGSINLKSFYIRRVSRIIPPALVYLIVIAVLSCFAVIHITKGEWLGALFFYRNYTRLIGPISEHANLYYTGHFWSLSVEEHFYIILPALLVFVNKRYRVMALSLLALLVAVHCAFVLHSRPWDQVFFHTDTRLDSLLIPALMAVLLAGHRDRFKSVLKFWPLATLGVLVTINQHPFELWQVMLIALLLPCMVLGTVLNPDGMIARILELAPLRFIGRISYSLYLWQQLFFVGHFVDSSNHFFQRFPVNYLLTFACAILSFFFIEQPIVKLGHRVAARYKVIEA